MVMILHSSVLRPKRCSEAQRATSQIGLLAFLASRLARRSLTASTAAARAPLVSVPSSSSSCSEGRRRRRSYSSSPGLCTCVGPAVCPAGSEAAPNCHGWTKTISLHRYFDCFMLSSATCSWCVRCTVGNMEICLREVFKKRVFNGASASLKIQLKPDWSGGTG